MPSSAPSTDMAPAEQLVGLIYVSSATVPLRRVELDELLAQSRFNNRRLGVSGCLLVHDDCILQYLEGPAEVVGPLMHKIRRDPRHHSVIEIVRCPLQQRVFAGWLMAHAELDRPMWDTLYQYLMQAAADRVPVITGQLLGGFLRAARPAGTLASA